MQDKSESNCIAMLSFMKRFLKLNQIFGSSVVNCYSHRYASCFLITFSSIHSILSFSLIFILIKFRKNIIKTETPSSIVNEYIQILSPLVVYFISVAESIYCRKIEIKIWKNIKKCEELCDNIHSEDNQRITKIYKAVYIIIFTFYSVIPFIPEMYNLVFNNSISWQKSYMLRIWPFVMTRFNHLHYLLYVTFLKHKLEFISSLMTCEEEVAKNYGTIKKLHLLSWQISFDLSRRFGLSETANLLNYFLIGIVAIYWIFIRLVFLSWSPILCKNIYNLYNNSDENQNC